MLQIRHELRAMPELGPLLLHLLLERWHEAFCRSRLAMHELAVSLCSLKGRAVPVSFHPRLMFLSPWELQRRQREKHLLRQQLVGRCNKHKRNKSLGKTALICRCFLNRLFTLEVPAGTSSLLRYKSLDPPARCLRQLTLECNTLVDKIHASPSAPAGSLMLCFRPVAASGDDLEHSPSQRDSQRDSRLQQSDELSLHGLSICKLQPLDCSGSNKQ